MGTAGVRLPRRARPKQARLEGSTGRGVRGPGRTKDKGQAEMKQALRDLATIAFIWTFAIIGGLCVWLSSSGIPSVVMGAFLPLAALIVGLMTQAVHQVFAK